jgi:hypothetical protein
MMTTTEGMEMDNTLCQGTQKEQELQSAYLVDDGLEWKEVPRDLLGYPPGVKYTQGINIPRLLVRIGISVLQGLRETYITGLECICEGRDQANVNFGYRIPGKQIFIDTKALTGVDLALGAGGIWAIRLITADLGSSSSKWLGNSECASMTIRLACDNDIFALSGKFDVSSLSLRTPPDLS